MKVFLVFVSLFLSSFLTTALYGQNSPSSEINGDQEDQERANAIKQAVLSLRQEELTRKKEEQVQKNTCDQKKANIIKHSVLLLKQEELIQKAEEDLQRAEEALQSLEEDLEKISTEYQNSCNDV